MIGADEPELFAKRTAPAEEQMANLNAGLEPDAVFTVVIDNNVVAKEVEDGITKRLIHLDMHLGGLAGEHAEKLLSICSDVGCNFYWRCVGLVINNLYLLHSVNTVVRHLIILRVIAHYVVIAVGKNGGKGADGKALHRLVGNLGAVLWITVNAPVAVVIIEVVEDDFSLLLNGRDNLVYR